MIFSNARVKHLSLARIIIFTILIVDLLLDDLGMNALWTVQNFHAHGVIRLLPESVLNFLLSEAGLSLFHWSYLAVLILGLLGMGSSYVLVVCSLLGTIWFHGMARGFGGHVNHQELIVLHCLFFLFSPLAFREFSLKQLFSKGRKAANEGPDHERARVILQALTFWVLLTYFYIGVARIGTSDIRVYFTNTMVTYVVDHCHKWNFWDISLAKDILNQTWLARALSVSFFFATILELSAPIAVFVKKLTPIIVVSLTIFHISIWVCMNIFFWQNLCLLSLPLLGWMIDRKQSVVIKPKIIFFDAKCGLCDGFIQWVAKADRKSIFKFAPLSGVTADREGIELSNNSNEWTIVLSDGENTYGCSSAVIEILKDLPKWDFVGDLLLIVPRFIRDFGYRCVATVRYRLFGTVEVCGLPPQELRAKLLP